MRRSRVIFLRNYILDLFDHFQPGPFPFIGKRQRITLRLLYAIAIPSVVCLSVVCCL